MTPVFKYNLNVFGNQTDILTGIPHFWNPDINLPYYYANIPNVGFSDLNYTFKYFLFNRHPTALEKMKKYIYGNWPHPEYLVKKENDEWHGYNTVGYNYKYGLIDLYLTGNIQKMYHWYKSKIFRYGDIYTWDNEQRNWNSDTRKKIIYNILGRIAHLLADMSIPAHTHLTWHISFPAAASDYYEKWASLEPGAYLDAEYVYENYGDFINPYNYINFINTTNGPVEYLMYCIAQISQHYASRAKNGNDNYNQNIGEIKSVLDTYGDKGPTTTNGIDYAHGSNYNPDDENMIGIRDATIPYLIRATAGLLFWFLVETGQFNNEYLKDPCHQVTFLVLNNQILSGDHYTFSCGIGDENDPYQGEIIAFGLDDREFIITSNARNVTFRAPRRVIFRPGFRAEKGSDVHVYTAQCQNCPDEDINPKYGPR